MSYGEDYYEGRSRHPMWAVEARLVRELAGPAAAGTVVDLGCGTGELLSVLAPASGVGIDCNETAVAMARRRCPAYTFRVGDVTAPGLEPGSADCIVSMHLVEHLADLPSALAAWREALVPGGRFVAVTPNAAFSHPEAFDDPDHQHVYTGPELAETVAAAGLRVRRVLSAGLWGVRRWPLVWRLQPLFTRCRLPAVAGLRWRGQSLALAAEKPEGDA